MKLNLKKTIHSTSSSLAFSALFLFHAATFAEQTPALDRSLAQIDADANKPTYKERVEERENPSSSVGFETVGNKALAPRNRWSDFLPILGKEARAEGYLLPLPFGISLVGLTQEQPFEVSRIGIAVNGNENAQLNQMIDSSITAHNLIVSDTTFNLRFDTWILPFWNIYGLVGRTEGKAELKLDVDLDIPTLLLAGLDIGGGPLTLPIQRCANLNLPYNAPPPTGGSCNGAASGLPAELRFDGTVLGYGTTVAGGYGDFFGMIDVNYSEADINIARDKTQQTVYSARLGWNGTAGIWTGQIWVGTMKEDIAQTLYLPAPNTSGIDAAVIIDQHASSPWNTLIGGQWNFSEEWSVILETNFGFSDRKQFMMQVGYRF
jgi:hypothetical protein